jgi:hypothetical protein
MTKNEYLIDLVLELQKIDAGDVFNSEIKQAVIFYQEMIDDMMEDGKTEEEAVASMENVKEIAERMRREFILPSAKDENASVPPMPPRPVPPEPPVAPEMKGQLSSTGRADGVFTRMKRVFDPGAVKEISITDANNGIQLLPGTELSIEYSESENDVYTVSLDGGRLCVKYEPRRWNAFRYIFGVGKGRMKTVLTVPESWHGAVELNSSNSALEAGGLGLEKLTMATTNGSISASDMNLAEGFNARTSNGRVALDNIAAISADVRSSNGRVNAENLHIAGQCRVGTSNGAVEAVDIAAEGIGISTTNGAIKVRGLNADAIKLTTTNGAVSGSIMGSKDDYRITSHTANGKNRLGNTDSGDRTLDVTTGNASIDISFVE